MIGRLATAGVLIISLGAAPAAAPPRAAAASAASDARFDVSIFYSSLAPYGNWHLSADFGWVWVPGDVAFGWRPYTTGHWVWVDDCGWTWVADEPWGWAAFHYGSWYYDLEFGWTWVPGPVWAPAWVVWRTGPGYCGWAPLPPSAGWSVGVGFRSGSIAASIATHHWSFVATRDFCAPRIHQVVVLPARNVTLVESTAAVGGLKAEGERIVNAGPEIGAIERAAGRRVERVQLRDVDRVEAVRAAKPGSGEVTVFRRKLGDAPKDRRPPEPEPGLVRGAGGRGPIDDATRQREATQLEARQSQEAKRLVEIHERETRDTKDPAKATELARRHEAELRELKAQHAREMRTLERRLRPSPRAQPQPPRRPPAPQPPKPPPKPKKKGPPGPS